MSLVLSNFEDAAESLRSGGVLLLGTDTLPGLHCRADDPAAVQRIVAAKGRPAGKSLLVLAGSADQARIVTEPWTEAQSAACSACWPGPFSLILPGNEAVASAVTGSGTTLAIRVPRVEALCRLILAVGFPLVSTSANRADSPPLADVATAATEFATEIDGSWAAEPPSGVISIPSAVVDLTVIPFATLRPGPLPFPDRTM